MTAMWRRRCGVTSVLGAAEISSQAPSPFRYFISPPEVIRLVVPMAVRFPLSLRNVNYAIAMTTQAVTPTTPSYGDKFALD